MTDDFDVTIPKLCGADVELAAFRPGSGSLQERERAADEVARELLREIDGLAGDGRYSPYVADPTERWVSPYGVSLSAAGRPLGLSSYDPQDWGRKFLPANGGCAYIDLGHLELCQPEVVSAYDHVAAWHAMLRIARTALEAVNQGVPDERKASVLVNNSDGHGNSYGSHLSFLVTRRAWDNIFCHKLHQMLFLASFQASAVVFAGAGKVGSENGAPHVPYQLSQRADFIESLTGVQTTYHRPLVNSRDEALCGTGAARLHCIFFDSTFCHVSSLLKVGVMQIVLAMIEAERVNPALILDSPLDALRRWSHDPTLRSRAKTASGEILTAVELQRRFLGEAMRVADKGGFDKVVPRAGDILALWGETLRLLAARDFSALSSRLDWVLKLAVLQKVVDGRADLGWDAPQIKHLDHVYSSLDPAEGLYWAFERAGRVDRVVSDEEIARLVTEPPDDTRAWTRAMLLRSAGPDLVDDVNWDFVRVRTGRRQWRQRTVPLANPLGGTRSEMATIFAAASGFEELIDALSPAVADWTSRSVSAGWPGWPQSSSAY